MPRRRTAFDRDFDIWMDDPDFAAGYAATRARVDAIDGLVRRLDRARIEHGFSKAHIARELRMEPSVVRRLFTHSEPNPQIGTLYEIARLLDLEIALTPRRDDEEHPIP